MVKNVLKEARIFAPFWVKCKHLCYAFVCCLLLCSVAEEDQVEDRRYIHTACGRIVHVSEDINYLNIGKFITHSTEYNAVLEYFDGHSTHHESFREYYRRSQLHVPVQPCLWLKAVVNIECGEFIYIDFSLDPQ